MITTKLQLEYPYKGKDITRYEDNFKRIKRFTSELIYSDSSESKPQISVVIPTYNAPFLFEAINSAINQISAPIYEIIIVDNCSNDEHFASLLSFVKSKQSNKIRLYRNASNIGMTGNWNRCVELANADEIVFLHSDDMLPSNSLFDLWAFHLSVEPEAAIWGKRSIVDNEGNEIEKTNYTKNFLYFKPSFAYRYNKNSLYHADLDCGCGSLLNRNVLLKSGGFYEDFYPNIDGASNLHYYNLAPIYRINKRTRIARFAVGTSIEIGSKYPACSYFARNQIIDKYFGGNIILKYLVKLNTLNGENKYCGYKKMRELNFIEKFLLKVDGFFYKLHTTYNIL